MRAAAVLQSVDIFMHLSPNDLEQLAAHMGEQSFAPNDELFQQGAAADRMFVIVTGAVQLSYVAPDGRSKTSQHVRDGESCGDVALFSGEPYAITATAVTDTDVLVLLKEDFEALVVQRPWIMRTVLAAIARRVSQVNRELVADQTDVASSTTNGRVVAVFSPRGGSGKTTLAINLALMVAATHPGRVALLDLDLLFDDAAFLLNVSPAASLASIRENDLSSLEKRLIATLLTQHESQLRVLVGATRPEDAERVTGAHVRAALAALKRRFALTVVDGGGSLGEPTLVPLELADRVLVVCTPDLASLRDVRDCQRLFSQALRLDRNRVTYCFNHPLPVAGLSRAQFESALEQSLAVDIPHAGDLAARGVRPSGHPQFCRALERLAADFRPAEVTHAAGTRRASSGRSGLARVSRLFGRRTR